jgi:peptidoglycan/LPS O-acetylase OafA/YrhL
MLRPNPLPDSVHTPSPERRFSALDGLRGIAIALVVWHHLVEPYLPLGSASWLGWLRVATNLSWSGVDLFFVLSGYFIGGILIDHRTSPELTRAFYVRRAVRILPLYYATLAFTLLLAAHLFSASFALFPGWIYSAFLTNFALSWHNAWDWYPLSVLWSIAVEEQFYLAAPWIVRWMRPARLPVLMLSLVCLAWLLRVAVFHLYPGQNLAGHVLMPMRMDTLACGVLLAWAVRTPATAPFFRRLAGTWPVWLAAGGGLFFLLAIGRHFHADSLAVYFGYTVMALTYTLLVAVVAVVRPPMLVRLLSSRPCTSFGRYSYFIYLWHMLIGWGIIRWLGGADFVINSPRSLGIVVLAVAATWFAGAISWKYFEEPLVKFGRRYRY